MLNLPNPSVDTSDNVIKEKLHPLNFLYSVEEDATNSPPFNYYVY